VHWFRIVLAPVISFFGQAVVLVLLFQKHQLHSAAA
jgi:hypothetical protein